MVTMTLYTRQQKRHRSPRFSEPPVGFLFLPLEHTVVFLVFFISQLFECTRSLFRVETMSSVHEKVCVLCKYSVHVCMLSHFSCVRLCATSWTVAHQAPLSMGVFLPAGILEWVAISFSSKCLYLRTSGALCFIKYSRHKTTLCCQLSVFLKDPE